MEKILPDMILFLEDAGRLDSWRNFMKSIRQKTLPSDNIAFLLFFDVADWYANENVHSMRYSTNVRRFWALGYKPEMKIFLGKPEFRFSYSIFQK